MILVFGLWPLALGVLSLMDIKNVTPKAKDQGPKTKDQRPTDQLTNRERKR